MPYLPQRLTPDPSEPLTGGFGPLEGGRPVERERRAELLSLAPPGRILELSGRARTTLAARLLAAVQAEGDPVAWVTTRGSGLYPPDLVEAGIDLSALVVVRVPEARSPRERSDRSRATGADAGPRAAELLLRTGAFGAVVLDVPEGAASTELPGKGWLYRRKIEGSYAQKTTAWQGRLSGILRAHEARLILLTEGDGSSPSLGPLVSVRLELLREPLSYGGRLEVTLRVLKDKSGSLAWRSSISESYRGPLGLRLLRPVSAPMAPIHSQGTLRLLRPR